MKSIKYNTFFLTVTNGVQVLVNLALSVALARYFEDKELFGKYQQLFIIISFFTSATSSIPIGLSYFYGRYLDFSSRIKVYKKFWWTLVVLSLVIAFSLGLLSRPISNLFGNEFFIEYTVLFLPILVFRVLNGYFIQFYLVKDKISYYLFVTIFGVFLTILLVFFIFFLGFDVYTILLYLLGIEVFKLMLYLIKAFFYIKIKGPLFINSTELKYVIPLTSIALISTINIYVDKVMISTFLNPSEYAVYQVGAFSIPFIGIITGSFVTALIPYLAKLRSENQIGQIFSTLKTTTIQTSTILLPILIYCIVMGGEILVVFYSESYRSSGVIFQLYTCIYLLSVIAFSAVMNAIGLQRWIVVNSIINLVVNSLLNLFFIPIFGSLGAVYATLLSTYLGYFFPIYLLKQKFGAKFLDYFPLKHYSIVLFFSVLFSLLVYSFVMFFSLSNYWAIYFSFPYYALVLFILLQFSKSTRDKIVELIKNKLNARR